MLASSREMWIDAIKGNNARVFIEKQEKVRSPICEKILMIRAQRSIKCFTFNQKKCYFIYLFTLGNDFTESVFQLHFFSFLLDVLQQLRDEILIYFSCFSPQPIIHVIHIGSDIGDTCIIERATHNSFCTKQHQMELGAGERDGDGDVCNLADGIM